MIKDDYISLINQVQLDLKIDIVDKLCVYSYSYIVRIDCYNEKMHNFSLILKKAIN
jgi:hypothetical protein